MKSTDAGLAGRRRGRAAALQLLYQREVGGAEGPRRRGAARALPPVGGGDPAENVPPLGAARVLRRAHPPVVAGEGARVDRAVELYWRQHPAPAGPRRFAEELLRGTVDALERIDPLIESAADNWRLSRMAVIDRLVLRLAVYELLAAETPAAVVIDEAIELARAFGDEPSPRFVNGVLDAIRRRLDEDRGGPGGPAS